jgi:non-ribosomal peptide synthetase component E (peptide arylation enzyme)
MLIERLWLRWYHANGNWIPTPEEEQNIRAEQERQRAEQESVRVEQKRQRADREYERAERLAARLRDLGVDPSQF